MASRAAGVLAVVAATVSARLLPRPERDARREAELNARVARLLANMTTEQKARQIDLVYGNQEVLAADGTLNATAVAAFIASGGIGILHDLYDPGIGPSITNAIQAAVINATGVPVAFLEEGLHGLGQAGNTVFPQSIAMAATFDTALMAQVAATIALETRAYGIVQLYAPVIGTATDPRWGRVEETFGEDPILSAFMTYAWVTGAQGGPGGTSLATNTSIISEPKHYLAYSQPESGINTTPAHIGMRDLIMYFTPQWEAAIADAGARGVMAAYNAVDGVPNCANNFTLTELLRNQWGFQGWVLSDLGAVSMMYNTHNTASSPADAIAQYLNAGGCAQYYDFSHATWTDSVVGNIANGSLAMATLDARVADLLRVKMELGLFDAPYTNPADIPARVDTPANRQLAALASHKAIVLLQNNAVTQVAADGTPGAAAPLLPLNLKGTYRNIAVVGPSADVVRIGDYSGGGVAENFVTVVEGVRNVVAAAGAGGSVTYHPGCQIQDLALTGPMLWAIRHAYLASPTGMAGLLGTYYAAPNMTGSPSFTRLDWDVNFPWYVYGPNAYIRMPINGTAIVSGRFSAVWTGTITPPISVNGLIGVNSQGDAFRLTLDGVVVLDTFGGSQTATAPYTFSAGVPITVKLEYNRTPAGQGITLQWSLIGASEDEGIASAVATAIAADAAVVVVGEDDNTVGEWHDMNHLNLTGRQQELVLAVAATGVPTIVVLLHGRSLSIPVVAANVPAIISAWFAGQAGGQAVADVIAGAYNPAGRLPMTFPNDVGQLPCFYNYVPSARRGYVTESSAPTWPFGHGLSYSRFNYSGLMVTPPAVPPTGLINITVTVTNVSPVDGEEVVQVYVNDNIASVTTPLIQLRDFERIAIAAGASVTHTFTLNVTHDLWLLDRQYNKAVEPGNFTVFVGPTSDLNVIGPFNATFEVLPPKLIIASMAGMLYS